jgi:hypothetical protein
MMVRPEHLRVVPDRVPDATLHRTHLAVFHPQGHGFDRCAVQLTDLAHHVVEEMVPWLAPRKALTKGV